MTTSPQKTLFLTATTSGAFVCATETLKGDQKALMHWLFSQPVSPQLNNELLKELNTVAGVASPRRTLQILLKRKLISLQDQADKCPQEPMQEALPNLLSKLSDAGKAMITDSHGLCIASVGIDADRHEALSALASKITGALYHANCNVFDLLDMEYGLTCLYDVGSKKLFTFIPLTFNTTQLVAVTQGKAVFSGQTFRDLIWVLWDRYVGFQQPQDASS